MSSALMSSSLPEEVATCLAEDKAASTKLLLVAPWLRASKARLLNCLFI